MRSILKLFLIIAFLFCQPNCYVFAIDETKIDEQAIESEIIDGKSKSKKEINEIYIKEIEILGNNLVDTEFIRSQISFKEGYLYDKKNVVDDLNKIYKSGYFTQKIRALPMKIDESNIRLRIIVEENPPITGFNIEGNDVVSNSEILDVLQRLEGAPQNIDALNLAIEQVQELYAAKGYILARIVDIQDDPDGVVTIFINEGIIEDVIVDGNIKTKDFVVKRNILLKPGTVYNENNTRADILRLMGTQAFSDVKRDIEMNPDTGHYIVKIDIDEQRTGRLSLGIGLDSSSGFFGSVGFGENNFRGLGQKINLNIMAGTGVLMSDSSVLRRANLQAELSFLEPYFRKEEDSLGFRGYVRNFGSYQVPLAIEERYGGEVTFAHRFKAYKSLNGSISFGVENVNMKEGDESKILALYDRHYIPHSQREEQLKGGLFFKLTPNLTYDTRDSSMYARRGVLANVNMEQAINISDFDYSYGKLNGVIKKFLPAGKKSSIVLTAKGGGKINGKMPEFAAYSLGGPYSVRGFNISEIGTGNGFMMGSAEFRTPIPFVDRLTTNTFLNNIRLAAFLDAGKMFDSTVTDLIYGRPGYAISMGVGLRVFVPGIGPINLDYGVPISNTRLIDRKGGFFTFGMGEMF